MTTLQQNLARLTADRAELIAALTAVVAEGSEGWNEADGADLLTMCRAVLAKVDAQQTLTCKVQQ